MIDLPFRCSATPRWSFRFTADSLTEDTGTEVQYTGLPENELRDRATQDVAIHTGQYDAAMLGAYEWPI